MTCELNIQLLHHLFRQRQPYAIGQSLDISIPAMEFRRRNYRAEEAAYSLPRKLTDTHPLSSKSSSPQQDVTVDHGSIDFLDPLRALSVTSAQSIEESLGGEKSSAANEDAVDLSGKEWVSFKKLLMQRFPVPKMVSISSMSSKTLKSGKAVIEKQSENVQQGELDDPKKFAEDGIKVISQQEYVARLNELKADIKRAWYSDDHVTSLKLAIKVAGLLMDTSMLQFYPTVFVLATDIMDTLGDLVWERIRQRAEFSEDGTIMCILQDDFEARNICSDAKETCINWFWKIGSIQELLPRIYLELAIFPCWRFLHDRSVDCLMRLVMMTRGIADPLASAYCRLYLVHRAQKLLQRDTGHLITCINDLNIILARNVKDVTDSNFSGDRRVLFNLMEPTIEYIMTSLFRESCHVEDIVVGLGLGKNQAELFGKLPCISIILHHLLKELPVEVVCSNAVEILQLIEYNIDCSFNQCLNYKLHGLKLCEGISQVNMVDALIGKVIQVATQRSLDEYLTIVDAFMDIILQHQTDRYLNAMLRDVFELVCKEGIREGELASLQSVFVKLLTHFDNFENVFALNHFVDILYLMHGSSRISVSMHILEKATRSACIRDPTSIQLLFEVAQSLHDNLDFSNTRIDDNQQPERLISRFIDLVDHGKEVERQLTFLVECRGAFGSMNEIKETLVHSSNHLMTIAMRDRKDHLNFIKSCLAFSEVTIPSIPALSRQLNLYLETAEVALLCGLISHSDGLLDSAVSSLQNVYLMDGSRAPEDIDGVVSLVGKLCSFMLMVPGDSQQGITYFHNKILSLINTQLWMTPKMKIRALCSVVSLSATFSQNEFPYHPTHEEVIANDRLFFGHTTYSQDLMSLSGIILESMMEIIPQEATQAARGNLALEACNCIATFFKVNEEVLGICSKLVETAKLCLGPNDKYLRSTVAFVCKQSPTSIKVG